MRLNVDNEFNRLAGRSKGIENNIEGNRPFKRAVRLGMFTFDVESVIERKSIDM